MIKKKYFRKSFLIQIIRVIRLIDKNGRYQLISLIGLVILQAFFDVISLASLTPLIQIVTNKGELEIFIKDFFENLEIDPSFIGNEISLTFIIPGIVILIMIFSTIFRLYVLYKTENFIEAVRHKISIRLLKRYIYSDIKLNSSDIAKSILSEVDQFVIIVFRPIILMLTNVLVLFGIVCYLFYTSIQASFFSLFLLILFYLLFYIFSKRKLNIEGYKSDKANQGRFKTSMEAFASINDIKIYQAEDYFINRFRNFSRLFAKTNATYSALVASPKFIFEMLVFISIAFSVCLISVVNMDIFNSLPLLGIFAFAAYKSQPALSNVLYGINSIEYGSKIISNLHRSLNNSYDTRNKNKKNIVVKNQISTNNLFTVRNLRYIYDNNKGIKNINFSLEVPSFFVLLGESGVGKSTLLNLIAGNIKKQEGEIIFSKMGHKNYPKISFLHQEFSLYDTTIAENIAYGISREKINYSHLNEVIKQAEIYDYVATLKNGVNEIVGENGSNLSMGQRQRIALARALYFKPDILILDEPTSSLDKENERKIIETLKEISKKILVIMSSHKIKYVPNNLKIGYLKKDGIEIKIKK